MRKNRRKIKNKNIFRPLLNSVILVMYNEGTEKVINQLNYEANFKEDF